MDPDLMSASGLQFDVEQCESLKPLANAINRKGRTPATYDRHANAIAGVTSDRLIDLVGLLFNESMHQRNIGFEDFARAKLIGQIFMSAFGLSRYQQTRGAFVQTMHNPWPSRPRGVRQLCEMIGESVCEGPGVSSGGGVNHHARRLIDDDQIVIFKDNVEGNVFRCEGS